MSIGDIIRKRRRMADCSQRAIADKLGITNRAISNWERNVTPPRLEAWQFALLCEMLGCTLLDLVEGDERARLVGNPCKEAIAPSKAQKNPRAGRG